MGPAPSRVVSTCHSQSYVDKLINDYNQLLAQKIEYERRASANVQSLKNQRAALNREIASNNSSHAARVAELNRQSENQRAQQAALNRQLQAFEAAILQASDNDAERQQELIEEANRQRLARQREVEEARQAAADLRNSDENKCTDNQDVVRRQMESQRRLTETQRQLNLAEQERQNRIAELIQQEEEQEKILKQAFSRSTYANSAQVDVEFLDRNDNSQDGILPVVLEQSDNIDELSNNADVTVNNIFTNHYNKNLTTYMQNKIKINEMKNKIDNLNSNLQKKMNNRITYGTDGEIMFY